MNEIVEFTLQILEPESRGASEQDLRGLELRIGRALPSDYIALMRHSDGYAGDAGARILYIHSIERVLSDRENSLVAECYPDMVEVASDGGDVVYALDSSDPAMTIYELSASDPDGVPHIRIGTTMRELLECARDQDYR